MGLCNCALTIKRQICSVAILNTIINPISTMHMLLSFKFYAMRSHYSWAEMSALNVLNECSECFEWSFHLQGQLQEFRSTRAQTDLEFAASLTADRGRVSHPV